MAWLSRVRTLSQCAAASSVSSWKTRSARASRSSSPARPSIRARCSRYASRICGEVVLAVVALVRQAETRLLDEDEVALGVARIVVDEELEEARCAGPLEVSERGQQRGDGVDGGRDLEQSGDRAGPEPLDGLLVDEAGVEVAELALLRAGLRVLGLDDDVAHRTLGLFGEQVERSVARPVGGDLRALDPSAVDVTEQIVLRAGGGVELVELDAGGQGFGCSVTHDPPAYSGPSDAHPPVSEHPGAWDAGALAVAAQVPATRGALHVP